jgi:hypothetical protein
MHLVQQAAIVFRQRRECRVVPTLAPGTDQALEQPGPESIERLDAGHIDGDASGIRDRERSGVDQPLQRLGMSGSP